MFRTPMRESTEKKVVLSGIPEIEDTFEALLQYIYSGIFLPNFLVLLCSFFLRSCCRMFGFTRKHHEVATSCCVLEDILLARKAFAGNVEIVEPRNEIHDLIYFTEAR